MTRLVPIAVLGAVLIGAGLIGTGLIGVGAADGEPDRPRVEVVESGVIIKVDLQMPVARAAGTILAHATT
ncbi:hypothetical protein GCM10022247_19500 [Allokutzneria multivorans]|uniref:Uncharacterized protein n=1 Tax=Allokutzneria multivorans TaxID=1142134 RepID=A0ABP7RM30_9PSEU